MLLKQAKESFLPAFSDPKYIFYVEKLQETLKKKRHVDFSQPTFTSPDGQVITFPRYGTSTNPFLPFVSPNGSHTIEEQPSIIDTIPQQPKGKKQKEKETDKEAPSKEKYKIPRGVYEQLVANLPFKKITECKSAAKSKPYFMSKVALVDYIKQNKELERYFPKNYKTLTKDALCEVIFE